MKNSIYNIFVPYKDKFILYNSASGNLILTDKSEIFPHNLSNIEIERLSSMGFLTDNANDELNTLIKNAERHINSSKKNKFRILTTTACNARCPYCYEKGTEICSMDLFTAEKVTNFILDISQNKKIVEIEWFGGEPLLNTEAINHITELFLSRKKETLSLESSIITNGYLINDNIIQLMKEKWNTIRVQITLDGLSTEYENIKGLGKNSFNRVIKNIAKLCDAGISVDIRLNFNIDNIQHIEAVIKFLSECDFHDKIYVYVAKINEEQKTNKFLLEKETIYLFDKLHEYGFLSPKDMLPKTLKSPCAACRADYYTIHPSGRLYKCDRKLLSGNAVGHVDNYNLKALIKTTKSWLGVRMESRCKVCSLLPLCWNGCIYDRLNNLDRCYLTSNIVGQRLKLFVDEVIERNSNNGRKTERSHKNNKCMQPSM